MDPEKINIFYFNMLIEKKWKYLFFHIKRRQSGMERKLKYRVMYAIVMQHE